MLTAGQTFNRHFPDQRVKEVYKPFGRLGKIQNRKARLKAPIA